MPSNFSWSGQPHGGGGPHGHARASNPLVNYELSGTVRWLDVELERIVVGVQETDGHAGVFRGQDVTVDLEAARLAAGPMDELVPGTRVRIKLRLRRDLGSRLPDLLPALSVGVLPAAA
jgi:hypothetical protein